MPSKRDYYDVLGVSRSASAEEIRKAYKKLARKAHPDANTADPNAEQKFAEITEAWDVLGDEQKRRQYDQFGHAARGGSGPGGNPFEGFGGTGATFSFEDLFGGAFSGGGARGGRRRGPAPQQRGSDVRADITVPFQVAVDGGEHSLTVQSGKSTERLTVKVPAGIEDGQTVRLGGQGQVGTAGGPNGDLLVTVHIAPHPWFRRDGNHLLVDVPVSPAEAALGARVDVPTLTDGMVVLTIPPGTSSGARLRLRGKGVRHAQSGDRGDQFVVIRIVVPKTVSDDERSLYEQLRSLQSGDPRAGLWS
jgi:DnaJ-class molecular chaperone